MTPSQDSAVSNVAASVITVSDRVSRGEREDETGPQIAAGLTEAGYHVMGPHVVPDGFDLVRDAIRTAHTSGARLIITNGGTGIGPRDHTPEAVQPLFDIDLPNVATAVVQHSGAPAMAPLSRAVAGVLGANAAAHSTLAPRASLVVTLPGSKSGVQAALKVLVPLAEHAISMLDGDDHGLGPASDRTERFPKT